MGWTGRPFFAHGGRSDPPRIDAVVAGPYFERLMPVRVKICGITNIQDARVAIESGADALGFIFFSGSPRHVSPETATRIVREISPFVAKVGVFVDAPVEVILKIARGTGMDTIQLHGNESSAMCDELSETGLNVIKAFRVKNATTLEHIKKFRASAYLLDSYVPGELGGTGALFNWDLALKAKDFGTPIILAGGLDPENVSDAVAKVAPYGLDVSSGVEASPGKKDAEKVRRFVARAKHLPSA
jgi:phosphoribosylanthranilate isomerase